MDTDSTHQPAHTYARFISNVGSEEWLCAIALMDVDPSGVVRGDASRWLGPSGNSHRDFEHNVMVYDTSLSWQGWVDDVEQRGRGWSSTEWRLYDLVAGLTTGRPVTIVGTLDQMAEWEGEVWRILVEWGTGGNNRDRPGRLSTVRRNPTP